MNLKYLLLLLILVTSFSTLVYAKNIEPIDLLLMPFINNGLNEAEINTSYQLLTNELQKFKEINLHFPGNQTIRDNKNCSNLDCGIAAGLAENCDETLMVTLSKLGEKTIVQILLVDVGSSTISLADNINASIVEDLDMVMKRIAISTVSKKDLNESAQVGAIIDDEEKSSNRRKAAKFVVINFGYLYPQNNSYDNDKRSFTMDFTNMYEMGNVDVGLKLAGRYGFAATIFSNYLLTKSDICPYIGGGMGIHFINHDRHNKGSEDGFELVASTGMRFFRTYNFEVIANLDYTYTFNDFDDQALIFTIGIAMQK